MNNVKDRVFAENRGCNVKKMLLKSYTKKIFRAECNPKFESLHCVATLHQNIEPVLPYLNAVLGGFEYFTEPPSVTFKAQGKLITVSGKQIAINALKDEEEAEKILSWLKREINDAWKNRSKIKPSFRGMPKPKIIEIIKLLPKSNCRECNEPTCLVFATRVAEGVKEASDCIVIDKTKKKMLDQYMEPFCFE